MRVLNLAGIILAILGGCWAGYSFIALSGESIPYQDAPESLLKAQAVAIAGHESNLLAGIVIAFVGLGLIAISWLTSRKD
jgi:hypothetical protein